MILRTLILAPILVFFCAAVPPDSTDGVSFTGGDGSSIAQAIIIHAPSVTLEIKAEKDYIAKHFGPTSSVKVDIYPDEKRGLFNIWHFTTGDGKAHTLYFDVTSYLGGATI